MITSIFSKSKPINFLVVLALVLITFCVAHLKFSPESLDFTLILKKLAAFAICYVSLLLLNFIVGKNSLTKKNNYEILFFSLFLLMIPQSVLSWKIIVSNFFILLALRRIISLRTQKSIKKKLFDAAFWIAVASLFYFWAILFFVVIFAALIFYTDSDLKNWIIPVIGAISVYILATTYTLLVFNDYNLLNYLNYQISFDFDQFNSLPFIIAITVLISFGIWASFFYLQSLKMKMKTLKPGFKVVITTLLVAFAIIVVAPNKQGSEFLFWFAPLSVVLTNYLETIKEKWFKELFLATFLLLPVVLLLL